MAAEHHHTDEQGYDVGLDGSWHMVGTEERHYETDVAGRTRLVRLVRRDAEGHVVDLLERVTSPDDAGPRAAPAAPPAR